MSYQNKYNDFKAEVIIQLRKVLNNKGYDQTTEWFKEDEDECYSNDRYDLPFAYVGDEDALYQYYIVRWDGESFLCYNSEDMDYWIEIDDIDLFNLCKILDYLNELSN